MSGASESELTAAARASKYSPRLLGGCLLLTVLVGVGVVYSAFRRGRAALDAEVVALRAWIDAERAAAAAPRPPLLAPEPVAGNAAEDYLVVCWILGRGEQGADRPALAPEADALAAFAFPAGWRDGPEALRQRLGEELGAVVREGTAPSPELEAVLAGVGGATAWVRAGVRKGRCDWGYRLGQGAAGPLPDFGALRAAALLMAWDAEQADDASEAAERGLEIVAFGADVAQHPTLICYVLGMGIMQTGYGSLERTLRRDGIEAATCRRIVERLGALRLPGLGQVLERDRAGMSITTLAATGRQVDPSDPAAAPGGGQGAWTIDLWWGNGKLTADDYYARYAAAAEGPAAGRRAALEAIGEAASSPWTLQAAMSLPGLSVFVDNAWTEVASRRALRVLAAAQLHRLEHGALPTTLAALEPILGELPRDPHDPAAGLLRLVQTPTGELRCYSLGPDQADDGGALPPWRGLARDAWGDPQGLDVGAATAPPP